MKIFITGHQGLGNRGCEALLRSTVDLVRRRHPGATFFVPSQNPQADAAQWPQWRDQGVHWIAAPKVSLRMNLWARWCAIKPSSATSAWPLPPLSEEEDWALQASDLMLSIGGDNCTLDYDLASLALYVGMAERAQQRGVPAVLWGASVGPFTAWPTVEERMTSHLMRLAGITVRESSSAKVLQSLGINGRTHTPLVSDPAFTLKAEPVSLAAHWPSGSGPVLGLNISALASRARPGEHRKQARARLLSEAAHFITRLVQGEAARVVLVPHVSARSVAGDTGVAGVAGVGGAHPATARPDQQAHAVHAISSSQDDAVLLDELQALLPSDSRITRLPTWNAVQLKWAISQCDAFIGARTHAVIAALSSGVPAVALSYSLKARGIHRDLMDHEEGVLDVRHLDAQTLHKAWCGLMARASDERRHLRDRLPLWQSRAASGLQVLDRLNTGWRCE